MKDLIKRIIIDPEIMAGKPVIKDTGITVELILSLLAQGLSTTEILVEYPHLNNNDISACLLFAKKAVERKFNAFKVKTKYYKFNRDEIYMLRYKMSIYKKRFKALEALTKASSKA